MIGIFYQFYLNHFDLLIVMVDIDKIRSFKLCNFIIKHLKKLVNFFSLISFSYSSNSQALYSLTPFENRVLLENALLCVYDSEFYVQILINRGV